MSEQLKEVPGLVSQMPGEDGQKLTKYRNAIGAMTSAEAMELALDSERFATDCGPGDIAYRRFAQDKEVFFTYAVLLEKEENWLRQQANVTQVWKEIAANVGEVKTNQHQRLA